MTRRLLSATAIALFLSLAPGPAQAGNHGEGGYFDQPVTFVALEGAYAFNASSRNASFDPAVDKLGNIYDIEPAKPGGDGWQGKAELGQSINSDWDYRVSLSAINLEPDTAFSDNIPLAEQDLGLQTLDLELGYHPDHFGPLQARVFAGLRGIHSENQIVMRTFSAGGNETLTDTAFAGGPRIGLDLSIPLDESGLALVGSISGSVLFGSIDTDSFFLSPGKSTSASRTIWNLEGMAGLSMAISEGANLTLGYRAAEFGGLVNERAKLGGLTFTGKGQSDLLVHGPFARLTMELP